MFMLRRTHRRLALELQRLLEERRNELNVHHHANLRLQVELGLTKQARDKADADARYWRERAEKFLDQIALRQGMISEPTMTEAAPPVESRFDSVFAALGKSEIHTNKDLVAGAASTAPIVTGVDGAAAFAAVQEALEGAERIGR